MTTPDKAASLVLADYATGWTIPTAIAKQDRSVHIGTCIYGRYPGTYAYKRYGELSAIGLRRDGSWHKYGEPFDSAQQALDTLLATRCIAWGDEPTRDYTDSPGAS